MGSAQEKMREKLRRTSAEELLSRKADAPESLGSKIHRWNKNPFVKLAKMILGVGYGDTDDSPSTATTSSTETRPAGDVRSRYGGHKDDDFDIERWERMQRDHMAYRQLIDGKGDHDHHHH